MIPEPCKACRFRVNDIAEGQLCLKVPAQITLWDGTVMDYPGQALAPAFASCAGDLRQPRLFGRLAFWAGL